MTALYVVLGILVFLGILAFVQVGANAEYSDQGFVIRLKVGPVSKAIYPIPEEKAARKREKKAEKERKKKAKEKKAEREAPPPEKKGGKLGQIRRMLPAIQRALGKLRRHLVIDRLIVYYTAADPEDPAKAAMAFGGFYAATGAALAAMENLVQIKERDIRATVDFQAQEPTIYLQATCTLAVWAVISIAASLLWGIVKSGSETPTSGKEGTKNGQTSNRRPDGDDHAEDPGNG